LEPTLQASTQALLQQLSSAVSKNGTAVQASNQSPMQVLSAQPVRPAPEPAAGLMSIRAAADRVAAAASAVSTMEKQSAALLLDLSLQGCSGASPGMVVDDGSVVRLAGDPLNTRTGVVAAALASILSIRQASPLT
jgi:hypothetical protein